MDRVAEQRFAPADQPKIDSPGVDADAIEFPALFNHLPQRRLDLLKQARQIPVESIHHPDWTVGEAVGFFQHQTLSVKAA